MGQRFLISDRAADAIAQALGNVEGRTVVEIGPGRGILTAALLRRGAHVIGVELDERLAAYLEERFAASVASGKTRRGRNLAHISRGLPSSEVRPRLGQGLDRGSRETDRGTLELVRGDVLELDLTALARERGFAPPLLVVGNIPYGITSPLLRRLLSVPGELERGVLMLQREVAERLLASPGTSAYGALTVGVRAIADVTSVLTLSPAKFRPPPRVWSTVVRIDPRSSGLDLESRCRLERLTKLLFSGRRKQLQKILRQWGLVAAGDLRRLEDELGIPLDRRPENLPVEGFLALQRFIDTGQFHAFRTKT